MITIRKFMLSVAFLAVCLCGTGCFFTNATIENLGETRWRYSTYSTALSPDGRENVTTYRKRTEHDCWPFLTAYHVTWDTNSFFEIRTPVEDPDDVKVDPNRYVQPLFGEQRSSTGLVGYCWKALWLPSAFVTDVVLLPVYGVVLCIVSKEMLEAFGHGQQVNRQKNNEKASAADDANGGRSKRSRAVPCYATAQCKH